MSKKSFNESREKNYVNSEGLRQRRLKDEGRWKFNPTDVNEEMDDDYDEYEQEESQRFY
jgi:hypothetical protein